jgi:hypothetical protein
MSNRQHTLRGYSASGMNVSRQDHKEALTVHEQTIIRLLAQREKVSRREQFALDSRIESTVRAIARARLFGGFVIIQDPRVQAMVSECERRM